MDERMKGPFLQKSHQRPKGDVKDQQKLASKRKCKWTEDRTISILAANQVWFRQGPRLKFTKLVIILLGSANHNMPSCFMIQYWESNPIQLMQWCQHPAVWGMTTQLWRSPQGKQTLVPLSPGCIASALALDSCLILDQPGTILPALRPCPTP